MKSVTQGASMVVDAQMQLAGLLKTEDGAEVVRRLTDTIPGMQGLHSEFTAQIRDQHVLATTPYWVTDEITLLIDHMSDELVPGHVLKPIDLPSPAGFVMFERPWIVVHKWRDIPREAVKDLDLPHKVQEALLYLYPGDISGGTEHEVIRGASWVTVETVNVRDGPEDPMRSGPGIHIMLWTGWHDRIEQHNVPEDVIDALGMTEGLPTELAIDRGAPLEVINYYTGTKKFPNLQTAPPMYPIDSYGWAFDEPWQAGKDPKVTLDGTQTYLQTEAATRTRLFMFSFFRFTNQKIAHIPLNRKVKRRWMNTTPLPPDFGSVRIITLRALKVKGNEVTETHPEFKREYSHRWPRRGHWRNQPYPSLGIDPETGKTVTRPIWIDPTICGPVDKPLVLKKDVFGVAR